MNITDLPGASTLKHAVQQTETAIRTARIDTSGTAVDEVDPPSDIDEYWTQYKETGIVRANINQFVSDVVEPGIRVDAEDDATCDYFHGGDAAPSDAPAGGFLQRSAIHAGETHQPFQPFLKTTILNRWVRGTALVELLKKDQKAADSEITGFYHILPETVYPQVYANKNILIAPDDTDRDGIETTPRGEAAAYIQFDDKSVLGRREGLDGRDGVPLSQNDVMKQVLDVDIGGSEANETGVFGESIMAAITEEVAEYDQIKRDRYQAIRTKAYGIWLAQFNKEVYEIGPSEFEVVEWPDSDQNDWVSQLDGLKPGEVVTADGEIDLKKFESEVPDLEDTLRQYVDDITAPLPAPKYSVGFEKDINQFVSQQQEERYERVVDEERRYQERKWTRVFREVARRHSELSPDGVRVRIEPEQDTSPITSLEPETIDSIKSYAEAADLLAGPASSVGTMLADETILTEILQLPEDVAESVADTAGADASIEELEEALQEARDGDVPGIEAAGNGEAGG